MATKKSKKVERTVSAQSAVVMGSLKRALRVLGLVRIPASFAEYVSVEPYANGRERGFALVGWHIMDRPMVVFAEYRSSDAMVLYAGTKNTSDTRISGTMWDNRVMFSAKTNKMTEEKLAKVIQKHINDWSKAAY